MTGPDAPLTLGERLDATARAIAARHQAACPWAGGLAAILHRAAQLADPPGGRFERREVPPGPPPPAGPDWPSPAPPAAAPPRPAAEAGDLADAERPAAALPAGLRAELAGLAGPGAHVLQVRTDAAADALSRAHRADAVTTGTDVSFRAGRFRPAEPAGFALLAHEAAHVTALLDPQRAARRTAAGGAAAAEDAALAAETAALRRHGPGAAGGGPPARAAAGLPARPPPGAAAPPGAPAPWRPAATAAPAGLAPLAALAAAAGPAAAAARPMRAAEDRDSAPPPPFDVEALRRGLIADLMRQLRSDFERGG